MNDETIISSISVTDIVFDVYLRKWNFRAIPKVKTWSYFLTILKILTKQLSAINIFKVKLIDSPKVIIIPFTIIF
ncbi:MAG TPA: hypothetical protein VFD03_05380 [Clostridia bacterium]|nr:hypothetical protein [Clostridia bacterium]